MLGETSSILHANSWTMSIFTNWQRPAGLPRPSKTAEHYARKLLDVIDMYTRTYVEWEIKIYYVAQLHGLLTDARTHIVIMVHTCGS